MSITYSKGITSNKAALAAFLGVANRDNSRVTPLLRRTACAAVQPAAWHAWQLRCSVPGLRATGGCSLRMRAAQLKRRRLGWLVQKNLLAPAVADHAVTMTGFVHHQHSGHRAVYCSAVNAITITLSTAPATKPTAPHARLSTHSTTRAQQHHTKQAEPQ